MNCKQKCLFFALIIVWLSVFIKYETFAFLSKSSENVNQQEKENHGAYRIRESIREAYHKVVDKPNSKTTASSDSFRIRQNVKDAYHRVADKIIKPKTTNLVTVPKPSPNPDQYYQQTTSGKNYAQATSKQGYSQASSGQGYGYPQVISEKSYTGGPYYYPSGDVPKTKDEVQFSTWRSNKKMEKLGLIARKVQEKWQAKKNKDPKYNYPYHNYKNGIINDYQYRPEQYNTIEGETCTNNLEFAGIIYGKFMCPVEGYDLNAQYCCGSRNEQFCCTLKEKIAEDPSYKNKATDTFDTNNSSILKDNTTLILILAIVIPVLFLICIGLAICIFFTQKEHIYKLVAQKE